MLLKSRLNTDPLHSEYINPQEEKMKKKWKKKKKTEDEVFPNNWFSTHSDGRVVIYPMKVPSRAAEIREEQLRVRHVRPHVFS